MDPQSDPFPVDNSELVAEVLTAVCALVKNGKLVTLEWLWAASEPRNFAILPLLEALKGNATVERFIFQHGSPPNMETRQNEAALLEDILKNYNTVLQEASIQDAPPPLDSKIQYLAGLNQYGRQKARDVTTPLGHLLGLLITAKESQHPQQFSFLYDLLMESTSIWSGHVADNYTTPARNQKRKHSNLVSCMKAGI